MFGREPVAIAAAVRAVVLCAVAFGLKWTPEQIAAVMLAVEAVLAVVIRQSVTPNQTVQEQFVKAPKTLVALLLACALASSCGPIDPQLDPTRNLSPEAKIAYQSMKIAKSLSVVREVVTDGEKQGVFAPKTAIMVLTYCKQVVTSIDAAPGGWRAIALTGLAQLQKDIPPGEWQQLAPFLALARTLIEAFVPTIPVHAPPPLAANNTGDRAWAL